MSSTSYYFIPSLREGLSTRIDKTTVSGERAEIQVKLLAKARKKNNNDKDDYDDEDINQTVQLFGPGDVLGFQDRIVTRTDPKHNSGNFEPNYFPVIEFSEPDFLWRFTARKAREDNVSLDPWVTLIVLCAEVKENAPREFEEEQQKDSKTPCITVKKIDYLPNLFYAWQWAHVQVTGEEGGLSEEALKELIKNEPERAVCRLMCPRRLRPQTLYNAFVVPTFKLGVLAATGAPVDDEEIDALTKSWDKVNDEGGEFSKNIVLPYYFKWEFRTSLRGDFEHLVRLLEKRNLSGLGTRPMNCEKPGYGISGVNREKVDAPECFNLKMEGALQSPGSKYTPWGNDEETLHKVQVSENTDIRDNIIRRRYDESLISSEAVNDGRPGSMLNEMAGKFTSLHEPFQEEISEKLLNKPARDLGKLPDELDSGRFCFSINNTGTIKDISLKLSNDGKSVRFEWETTNDSTSRINYGLTSEYGKTLEYPVFRPLHVLTITGLTPHKKYHFRIIAVDEGGRDSETDDGTFQLPELPSVVPPIYGKWHRAQQFVDPDKQDEWINELNLDPRHRAAAGLGSLVINKQQEGLMASAWEQLGDIRKVNGMLRNAQLGRDTGKNAYERMKQLPLDQFLHFTSPVHKRVIMNNPQANDNNQQPEKITVDRFFKKNTRIPNGILDPAFRRIARINGPIRKRQKARINKDLITNLANGTLDPTGSHPGMGGMLTPCIISHLLHDKAMEQFTLSVTASGDGSVTVSQGHDSINGTAITITARFGTRVTVTANPSDTDNFNGWSGAPINGLSDMSVSFGMLDNYALVASFPEIPENYTLNVTANGPGLVKINDHPPGTTDTITDRAGTTVTVTAEPVDNLDFKGWSGNPVNDRTETSISFEMLNNYALVAHFPMDTIDSSNLGVLSFSLYPTPPFSTSDGEGTRFCEDHIKGINLKSDIEDNEPFKDIPGITEETIEAVENVLENWLNKEPESDDKTAYPKEFLEKIRKIIIKELDPECTIKDRIKNRLKLSNVLNVRFEDDYKGDPLDAIMADPVFPQPMYEPLRDLSQDYLLPGVEKVPQNTVALLQTNRRFLESYMVGCNHEFASELLWRKYPTDQQGSYFRQFWDVSECIPENVKPVSSFNSNGMSVPECLKDIKALRNWGESKLGENATCSIENNNIVLLIRGDLLKRYPNTVIYAVNAINVVNEDSASGRKIIRPDLEEFLSGGRSFESEPIRPIFTGTLSPDLTFFGFPFDEDKARGNDDGFGVYFIIEERVSETRFGLDLPNEDPLQSWDDLCWEDVKLGSDIDIGKYIDGEFEIQLNGSDKSWGKNSSSAERAWITMQKPVRIALHARQMLP